MKDTMREDIRNSNRQAAVDLRLLTAQMALTMLTFAVPLFVAAGTIRWPEAWIFLALFLIFTFALNLWLLKHNPGLLRERMTGLGNPGQKRWDKVFFGFVAVFFVAWLVLMGLDAVRYNWSHMPVWTEAVGAALLLCSFYGLFTTFRENTYLSSVVRIQNERGQKVVSTGPYQYVRHPMYAVSLMLMAGMSLLLGSWYGLLSLPVLGLGIAYRAVREERVLKEELSGYREYMNRVKYRFIPYVW